MILLKFAVQIAKNIEVMRLFKTFLIFILGSMQAYAQEKIPGEIPTPNAASLGRFGDIPMSYYTGCANIDIPLYNFNVRGVQLPISLSYDGTGMLMNSLPSWTGMNWALNCGGVITRQKCGEYDEQIFPSQAHIVYSRYFESYNKLPQVVNDNSLLWNEIYTYQDLAPDIFSFNFMGKTGKFFLGNDGQWKVRSKENLEVLFNIADANNYIYPLFQHYPKMNAGDPQPKVIKGFTIRDENGTCYVFGGSNDAIDYTTEFFHMSVEEDVVSWHPTSWYLTKVIDKYGQDLYNFTYTRGKYVVQVYNCYQNISNYNVSTWHNLVSFSWHDGYEEFPYGVAINSPVYLTNVTANNGVQVNFSLADNPISIKNMYSVLYVDGVDKLYERMARRVAKWCEKYPPDGGRFGEFMAMPGAFYYLQLDDSGNLGIEPKKDILSYAGLKYLSSMTIIMNPELGTSNSVIRYLFLYNFAPRMVMTNINILEGNQQRLMGKYKMNYFNLNQIPTNYLTKAIDHWGFYNGIEYLVTDNYYTKRNPDTLKCKYGMLSEIVYPTGGCSVFEYEAHRFSKRMSYDRQTSADSIGIAGGVRVKSISEYEDENHTALLKRRVFSYNIQNSTTSSGVLAVAPKYTWYHWSQEVWDSQGIYQQATMYFDVKQTSSIIPLSNSFGPHVAYSHVEETFQDGSKKTYDYSNYADTGCQDIKPDITFMTSRPSPFEEYSDRSYRRGNLLHETWYNTNGTVAKKIDYEYRTDNFENSEFVYTTNMLPLITNGVYRTITGVVYKLYYPNYDVSKITETVKTADGDLITTKSLSKSDYTIPMTYPYSHQANVRLSTNEITQRSGKTDRTDYSYASFNGNSNASKWVNKMFCLTPEIVEHKQNGTILKTMTTGYKQVNMTTSENVTGEFIVPAYEEVKYNDGTKDTLITYDQYTQKGALLKYTKRGEPSTWQKWAYNDNYLVMKGTTIYNGTISDQDLFNQSVCLGIIRNYIENTNGFITGYVYNPIQGVTAIVQPNGSVTYYNYDGFGRLSEIRNNKNQILQQYEYNYRSR